MRRSCDAAADGETEAVFRHETARQSTCSTRGGRARVQLHLVEQALDVCEPQTVDQHRAFLAHSPVERGKDRSCVVASGVHHQSCDLWDRCGLQDCVIRALEKADLVAQELEAVDCVAYRVEVGRSRWRCVELVDDPHPVVVEAIRREVGEHEDGRAASARPAHDDVAAHPAEAHGVQGRLDVIEARSTECERQDAGHQLGVAVDTAASFGHETICSHADVPQRVTQPLGIDRCALFDLLQQIADPQLVLDVELVEHGSVSRARGSGS